jgi:hypothetical protein
MDANAFQVELGVFQAHRNEWLRSYPDTFVVIQGSEVAEGFFSSYGEALREGLRRFGAQRQFLVKQVAGSDPVYLVS